MNVATPTNVYPFYENATQKAWGQSPREAQEESASLWSVLSAVAASQPNAWLRRRFEPAEIVSPSGDNRPIAWPYFKLMVANPTVNQGAAVLLTSLARARSAGIAENKLVHIWGGAAASEPRDYLARDDYHHSGAMEGVLETILDIAGGNPGGGNPLGWTSLNSTAVFLVFRRWRGGSWDWAEISSPP